MVRARVGYHRIYNALNCSLEGQNELLVQFSLGQHEIEVYFVRANHVPLRPDRSTAISSYTPPIDLFWRTPRVLRNIGQLADVMARINASDARLRSTVTPALQWLLRAWSEGNHVYRFLNLF